MRLKTLATATLLVLIGAGAGAYLVGSDFLERLTNRAEREWKMRVAGSVETDWTELPSALHALEMAKVPVTHLASGGGGATATIGEHILIVGRRGLIDYLSPDGVVRRLDTVVPMNLSGLLASETAKHPRFKIQFFRVHGLLALETAPGEFDLLVSHHRFAGSCVEWLISRVRLTDIDGVLRVVNGQWETLFTAEPCIPFIGKKILFVGHQAGGAMVALDAKNVLFSVGDHRLDGIYADKKVSMDPNTHLGKILRLNLSSLEVETIATGVRNPQGLVVAEDGRIWETEHGPRGGDEINEIVRGGNYGWPEVTYGMEYGGIALPWPPNPDQGRHEGYLKPKFAFVPSVGLTQIIEIRGDEFPRWQGDLVAASLRAESLFRFRLEGDTVVYVEQIELNERLRDLIQLENGQIVLLGRRGDLIFLRNAAKDHPVGRLPSVAANHAATKDTATNAVERGNAVFDAQCGTCHALFDSHEAGPHLVDLIGRKAGGLNDYAYSPALKQADFKWNQRALRKFLSDGKPLISPITMPRVILPPEELDDLIAYFESLDR